MDVKIKNLSDRKSTHWWVLIMHGPSSGKPHTIHTLKENNDLKNNGNLIKWILIFVSIEKCFPWQPSRYYIKNEAFFSFLINIIPSVKEANIQWPWTESESLHNFFNENEISYINQWGRWGHSWFYRQFVDTLPFAVCRCESLKFILVFFFFRAKSNGIRKPWMEKKFRLKKNKQWKCAII